MQNNPLPLTLFQVRAGRNHLRGVCIFQKEKASTTQTVEGVTPAIFRKNIISKYKTIGQTLAHHDYDDYNEALCVFRRLQLEFVWNRSPVIKAERTKLRHQLLPGHAPAHSEALAAVTPVRDGLRESSRSAYSQATSGGSSESTVQLMVDPLLPTASSGHTRPGQD